MVYPGPWSPGPSSHSALRARSHWLGPTDANSAGFVHGGVVMKLCDSRRGASPACATPAAAS